MTDMADEFQEKLPASWEKKIKSEKLKKLLAEWGMWVLSMLSSNGILHMMAPINPQ